MEFVELHPISIAFLKYLLEPYFQVVKTSTSQDAIVNWISQVFPEHSAIILKSFNKESNDYIKSGEKAIYNTFADIIKSEGQVDTIVLPWDIQQLIKMTNLISLFSNKELFMDDKLPVTIEIDNNSFEHKLTADFVLGLLIFSSLENIKQHFRIVMFGVPFTTDYIQLDTRYRGRDNEFIGYRINIDHHGYKFATSDFMQGFATGALWNDVDHHQYWSQLRECKYDATIRTTSCKSITF